MCTHVAVINAGQVRAAGTVEQVAAGEDLEDRFLELVGGRHEAAHLSWLDGGVSGGSGTGKGGSFGAAGDATGDAFGGLPGSGRPGFGAPTPTQVG